MFTSYYAKQKKNNFKDCVAISIKIPYWYKGDSDNELIPTLEMLNKYKETKKIYLYNEFIFLLIERGVTAESIYEKYKDKILCCWEKDVNSCHRGYIAIWIEKELNIKVKEIT